jgi:hypothetical protein
MSPTVQAALDRLAVGIVPDLIELIEIAAEVRRLEQDAKRLDWLEQCRPMPTHYIVLGEENAHRRHSLWLHGENFEAATLRAAIDAAMKGTT